jgi:hypothetical protein
MNDQNTKQIGQKPIDNPFKILKQPKACLKIIVIIIFVIFVIGGFSIGKELLTLKQYFNEWVNQTITSPTVTKNEITASWKTYYSIDNSIRFKYPADWQAEKEQIFGSRTVTAFKYKNNLVFELTIQENYNQVIGKPYKDPAEFLGQRLSRSRDVFVDGQPAKIIEYQGDPGHVPPYQEVVVFTPENKAIVSLYFKSSYYNKPTADRVFKLIISTFEFLNKSTSDSAAVSYGIFYPYSDGATINNFNPTIIGKISQSKQSYLLTKFGKEKSPFSGENEYFLRFIPGRTKNLEIKIDNLLIQDVYGIPQYPTVICKRINFNPDGTVSYDLKTGKKSPPDDIYTSEDECFSKKSADIPPLIFFAKPEKRLSSGKHTLTILNKGNIIGSMVFIIDNDFQLPTQNIITQLNQADYFASFDIVDNCISGFYYDRNFLKIPLPNIDNRNLFFGLSFPQTRDEYGRIKRRRVQIGFDGKRFDLFFPQSSIFFEGKSFKNNTLAPEKGLFIPKDHLFFIDGEKAEPQKKSPDGGLNEGEYFEIYPVDISGYEYQNYSLPWQTSGSSGCDG